MPHISDGKDSRHIRFKQERVPLETTPTREKLRYLQTKREKLGHILANLDAEVVGAEHEGGRP